MDNFAEAARQGMLLGNVMLDRYMRTADRIDILGTDAAQLRIDEVGPVIRRYSEEYDLDPGLALA